MIETLKDTLGNIIFRHWTTHCFVLLFLIATPVISQSSQEIKALNNYVDFLNESIHGLFTAHALMVISNKEVNKYIDLDSYSLNKLSNNELQSNLFDKSDKQNYTTFQSYSPLQLMDICQKESSVLEQSLANRLNVRVVKIGIILNRVNSLRFEIFDFIDNKDLNTREPIYKVYEMLEECASLFESFAVQQKAMMAEIRREASRNKNTLYHRATEVHKVNKSILNDFRNENSRGVIESTNIYNAVYEDFHEELQSYSNYNKAEYKSYIKNRSDSIYQHLVRFQSSEFVPRAYKIYGKYYYYHNQISKRFLNWSGPGYVRYLNKMLKATALDFVKFSEHALIFKVVYPMKLDELNGLKKTESFVSRAKMLIENKLTTNVLVERPQEDKYLTIELSDYNLIDKDTISVLLNGEYILENYCLGSEAKELKILLSDYDRIMFEVVAENEGVISPNTPLIAYRIDGQRKKQRLHKVLAAKSSFRFSIDLP